MPFQLFAPFVPYVPRRADRGTARPADGAGGSGEGPPAQAVMSFAVKRAQAAEPNTAAYSPCSSRFLTISFQ